MARGFPRLLTVLLRRVLNRPVALPALLLAALAGTLEAHDPGLSALEVRLGPDCLLATLSFAGGDLPLPPPEEACGAVEARVDGRPAPLLSCDVRRAAAGGTEVILRFGQPEGRFAQPEGRRITVRSAILDRLPHGHRQWAAILDRRGGKVAEALLHAGRSTLEAELSPVPAAERAGPAASRAEGAGGLCGRFLLLGAEHILTGWDHLAFLLGILLAARTLRQAAGAATAFCLAHSLTLAASALGLARLPPALVEPAIALSVAWVGVENVLRCRAGRGGAPRWGPWALCFAFGLLHGFGFASALAEVLPTAETGRRSLALVSFNLGVEAGQLAAALPAFHLLARLHRRPGPGRRARLLLSLGLCALGGSWFLGRVFAA